MQWDSEIRDFKNYLARQNELMSLQIYDFIKKNSKMTKSKLANFKDCLDNFSRFSESNSENNVNKTINFIIQKTTSSTIKSAYLKLVIYTDAQKNRSINNSQLLHKNVYGNKKIEINSLISTS